MIRAWMDFIFPPLCQVCEEPSPTRLLCPACWDLAAPTDPSGRCLHCFAEIESVGICSKCRSVPALPIPSAFVFEPNAQTHRLCKEAQEFPEVIAAYVYFQWERMGWPIPDAVIPLPSMQRIADPFARLLQRPPIRLLREGGCDCAILEENQTLLILSETSFPLHLRDAAEALSEAFPKKMHAMSLFSEYACHQCCQLKV